MYGTKDEKREQLEAFLYYWGVLNEKTLADQLLKNYNMEQWVTDREPTSYECDSAGDTGFILCVSGQRNHIGYDHAIVMGDCLYEEGQWFISGIGADGLTIHGWMLPPEWEGKSERITRTEKGAGKDKRVLDRYEQKEDAHEHD